MDANGSYIPRCGCVGCDLVLCGFFGDEGEKVFVRGVDARQDVAVYENTAYFLHGDEKAVVSMVVLDLNVRFNKLKERGDLNGCVAMLSNHRDIFATPEILSEVQ